MILCSPWLAKHNLLAPASQFVVEVTASDTGVGVVLFQRSTVDDKLHPCAFSSLWLTLAEINYNFDNQELLVVLASLAGGHHGAIPRVDGP